MATIKAKPFKIIHRKQSTVVTAFTATAAVMAYLNRFIRRNQMPTGAIYIFLPSSIREPLMVNADDFLDQSMDGVVFREFLPNLEEPEKLYERAKKCQLKLVPARNNNQPDPSTGFYLVPQNQAQEDFNDQVLLKRLADVRKTNKIPLELPYKLGWDLASLPALLPRPRSCIG